MAYADRIATEFVADAQALLDAQQAAGARGVDLGPIAEAAACFYSAAQANAAAVAAANAGASGGAGAGELSRRGAYMERSLLGDGLPDRPFFRHALVGAGHGR